RSRRPVSPPRSRSIREQDWRPPRPSWRISAPAAPAPKPRPTRRRSGTKRCAPVSPSSSRGRRREEPSVLIVGTRTLKSALEDKARRFPDRPLLLFEDSKGDTANWTWREFDRAVNRAAHLLLRHGLGRGDKFNLHLGNCPEFLLFWMAAAKTGAVMVPVNPASTPDEMEYILGHSEARLSITEPQYAGPV